MGDPPPGKQVPKSGEGTGPYRGTVENLLIIPIMTGTYCIEAQMALTESYSVFGVECPTSLASKMPQKTR